MSGVTFHFKWTPVFVTLSDVAAQNNDDVLRRKTIEKYRRGLKSKNPNTGFISVLNKGQFSIQMVEPFKPLWFRL